MSFFSRLFRKAPSLSSVSTSAPRSVPLPKADNAPAKPSAVDRALAAIAEQRALQAAIDSGDVQAVARLVIAGTSTKVRQSAAHAIDDPDVLRQLIRDVRGGNDKNVYKALTSKRDALLETARQLEQLRAEIDAAAEAIERHSQGAYNATFSAALEQFESRWQTVAAQADPKLQASVQQWIDRSREIIAAHLHQVAAQASRALAAANAAAEAQHLHQQRVQAIAATAAEQDQAREAAMRTQAEQQQAELQASQQTVRQIGEWIRKARAALSDGSTSRAATMRQAIEEKLAGAPPLPDTLASQLQLLDQQLAELKDWKSFSVTPKRAELIEEMQLLIGVALDPPVLADRIKSIRDEWRTLSKGAGEAVDADLQRFEDAAQKAYQPCNAYFAAQALVREENMRRRDALLSRLTAFEAGHDWQQPDWRTLINTLRETKQQWYDCSPVDRLASKPQQARFEAITAGLQGRLDAEYARNLEQKKSLIERAQALLAGDDSRKAIDAIKELQQQWRTVGPVPRDADQRLWGEFRQHCDAVFQKRQQVADAHTAELESNKAQALTLCEQLEKIAALDGTELLERASARVELRRAFDALGEFPRADTRELRSRFNQALDRCEASLARQRVRDAERAWSDLFEAANQVRAYRLAVARGLDAVQISTLKQAAETFIGAVPHWPERGLQALNQALARECSEDLVASELSLKMLCIRAEILTDTPTPPEDQPLRRDYQLQRLVKGMGHGVSADETNLDAMAMDWVGIGPVDEAAYQPLLQRFRRCRERSSASVS